MLLNTIREGKGANVVKYIAMGFVLLATMGMVFMDVGGFFRGGTSGKTVLAKVGSTTIDRTNFERMANTALRAQNMNLQEAYRFGLLQNLLEEMMTREALRQEALSEGIMIGRDNIAAQVHAVIKEQIQPGESAQDALNRMLRAQGTSESELVNNIRAEMTNSLITAPLKGASLFVPRLQQEALGRYKAERRDITFFTLTPENVGKDIKATDDILKTYYDTVKDQYQLPEERSFKAIVLSADDVKDSIKLSEDDIKATFEERRDQFRAPAHRKIEQLVVQKEEAATNAANAARKGKSFKSIAPESYRAPTDVDREGLPPELASAIFEAKNGTILNPIKTPLGWHIVRVISATPAREQSYNEVRNNLRKELESDALHTEMDAQIARVDEQLGSGASLEQTASDMNLAIRTIGPIDSTGNYQQGQTQDSLLTALAQNKDQLISLFELMEGETGDLVEISDGLYAAFSIENIRPTRDREFEQVRNELEKRWLTEQRNAAMNTTVDALFGALSRGEKDFADAAKESGAVLKTARDVSRESKVAGLNDPIALGRLFDETNLDAVVKVPMSGNVILAKVLDARIPEAGKGVLSANDIKQQQTQTAQAVMGLFLADVRARHKATIYTDRLEKIYTDTTD